MNDWQFGLYIAALLFSPLIAVQVTERLRRRSEKVSRQRLIFTTLMRTRAYRLAPDHVQALNSIDAEFYEEKAVIDAWRAHLDHLNTDSKAEGWAARTDELFLNLLSALSEHLGYSFDRAVLKGTSYFPMGHGEFEKEQNAIRKGLVDVLAGARALPVELREPAKKI